MAISFTTIARKVRGGQKFRRFAIYLVNDRRGASAVKYGTLIAVIAVAIVVAVADLGSNLNDNYGDVVAAIEPAAGGGPSDRSWPSGTGSSGGASSGGSGGSGGTAGGASAGSGGSGDGKGTAGGGSGGSALASVSGDTTTLAFLSANDPRGQNGGRIGGGSALGASKEGDEELRSPDGDAGSSGLPTDGAANFGLIALITLLLGIIGYFITRNLGSNQDDARAEYRDRVLSRLSKASRSAG